MIPDSMAAAVSHVKVRQCLAIEQARQGSDDQASRTLTRLWKVFLSLDGLLFSENATPTPTTRRERLQE
eukprot:3365731-Pyramimonas_sp.AAC.1